MPTYWQAYGIISIICLGVLYQVCIKGQDTDMFLYTADDRTLIDDTDYIKTIMMENV